VTTFEQHGGTPAPARKASGGIVALGVINIIYAILFRLCCGVGALLVFLSMGALTSFMETMPEMDSTQMMPFEMMSSGPMQAYSIINGLVLLILGTLLLIGGIGLLKLKPWGRTLSLGVAVGEIVWVLMSFAINVFFIYPQMSQMMAEEVAETPQMVGNVIGGIIAAFFSLVYPIVLLIFLNIESIKKQFETTTPWGQQ
jgi:hypothetical protein